MATSDRYRDVPPSISGRWRHDVVVGIADASVAALWAISGVIRKMKPPVDSNRLTALTVVDRQVVAHDQDVVALTLSAADGAPLPRWHPGAHLDIALPSGRLRQYSLCGDPDDVGTYRIAVRRIVAGGGGSIEVHDDLGVGATLGTHGPRNAFPLTVPGYGSPTQRFRFIAGGIGITPILPMLARAERLGVNWSMVYAGRSRASLPFIDEVSRFGERIDIRTDDVGGVPSADELLGDCSDGTTVYACGPAPMLTAIRARLAGRDNVELHFERFAAPPVVDGREFTVRVASTGQEIVVGADETLLSALRRSRVAAAYSCQQGFCGTCRTRVLAGAVDHRDTLLTEPERAGGMMLVCISRAANGERLTLDL
ncbi:oxidoreductase [Mycolicibacterium moriokaense]|nr:oxidoreductase [Mycolicibacterium moriokaense]